MDDTPNCWALGLRQQLDESGMEITLNTQALTSTSHITDHIVNITTDQQRLIAEIGIAQMEDLASPTGRNWTPIAYAQPKLQFTKDIIRPPTHNPPTDIAIRPMMTSQHQDKDKKQTGG